MYSRELAIRTCLLSIALTVCQPATAQSPGLLPIPKSGTFGRPGPQSVKYSTEARPSAFERELKAFRKDWPTLQSPSGIKVVVTLDRSLQLEEYTLSLGNEARVRAGSPRAVAWALQSLGQLGMARIGKAELRDRPTVGFRTVMIDVARRYHSPSTLRQIVRWCQAGKVRFLQLHLTDDQNWMLPSEVLSGIDRFNTHHRSAYTPKELKELQAFASARGVCLLPEIDIPGHSSLLVRHNPKLFQIKGSPSSSCVNFASAEVRSTLKGLLKETIALFPEAPYIHIGGDEAWYPDAQNDDAFEQALAKMGVGATPQRVFIDFVAEMAEAVVADGKTPLIWEGFGASAYAKERLPKEAAIVAWDGDAYPPDKLLSDGFRIVNAGWNPLYVVNHYPYDAFSLVPLSNLLEFEPRTFGWMNRTDPLQSKLQLAKDARLLGAMLCWWEGHEWNARTTLPERILAFGSRSWNSDAPLSLTAFKNRSQPILANIRRQTIPFEVSIAGARTANRRQFEDRAVVTPRSKETGMEFGIRTDGRVPTLDDLAKSANLATSGIVTIQAFRNRQPLGETEFLSLKKVEVVPNLAMGARVESSTPDDPLFPASLVTDGVANDIASFWLGFRVPCSLVVDLGKAMPINRVDVVPFWAAGQSTQYAIDLGLDKNDWSQVASSPADSGPLTKEGLRHRFETRPARFIRVRILGSAQFPPTLARIHEVRAFLDPQAIDLLRRKLMGTLWQPVRF